MKKILFTVLSLVCTMTMFSQTANQIVAKMEEFVTAHEQEGVSFLISQGLSYVDSYRKTYTMSNGKTDVTTKETWKEAKLSTGSVFIYDNKMRVDSDNGTEYIDLDINRKWFVASNNNEVQFDITTKGDINLMNDYFKGLHIIRPAYKLTIKDETDDTWTIYGKRKLFTRHQGVEKNIELTIRKDTYQPVKVALYDVIDGDPYNVTEITRKNDIRFGISEKQVTFNAADISLAEVFYRH